MYKISQMTADKYGIVIYTEHDLVQPSRQTRHSDPDLSYTTTGVYKYSFFFQEQYVIGTLYTHCLIIVV